MLVRGAAGGCASAGSVSIRYMRMKPRISDMPTQACRLWRAGAGGGASEGWEEDGGSLSAPTMPGSVGVFGGSSDAWGIMASIYPGGAVPVVPSAPGSSAARLLRGSVAAGIALAGACHRMSSPVSGKLLRV